MGNRSHSGCKSCDHSYIIIVLVFIFSFQLSLVYMKLMRMGRPENRLQQVRKQTLNMRNFPPLKSLTLNMAFYDYVVCVASPNCFYIFFRIAFSKVVLSNSNPPLSELLYLILSSYSYSPICFLNYMTLNQISLTLST